MPADAPLVWVLDDEWPEHIHNTIFAQLEARGLCAVWTSGSALADDRTTLAATVDGLLLQVGIPAGLDLLTSLGRCRGIVVTGTGYDNVDLAAAQRLSIPVSCVPDYCTDEVADHTLALLLAYGRRLLPMDRDVRSGDWEPTRYVAEQHRFADCTLGLLGFGRIGTAVARRARVFGLRVIAFDKEVGASHMRTHGVEAVDFATLLEQSDYLSLHVPLSPQTQHLIDAAALAAMRTTAVLINTSRGAVVDQSALIDALRAGRLGGAALDVFCVEPIPPGDAIRTAPRTLLTPHAAYSTAEALKALVERSCAEIAGLIAGREPQFAVNGVRKRSSLFGEECVGLVRRMTTAGSAEGRTRRIRRAKPR